MRFFTAEREQAHGLGSAQERHPCQRAYVPVQPGQGFEAGPRSALRMLEAGSEGQCRLVRNGELGAAYAPYLGTLPPAVERQFRAGGLEVAKGYSRENYRASFRKLSALVGALHRAGVPIVAGTDGSGMELVRELELYVKAGFTPAEALNSATLATAHLVGADAHTGSIAVGKDADLLLVRGDPSRTIGDLRHTELVLMDGKVMDADALRTAGGFGGRPRFLD